MKTLQNKFWQTHRCSPSRPARISLLNLSLNILGRFLGRKFSVESCEGTLGVMRDIWRHEWGGGDLEHWALTPSQHNKLVNSFYKYNIRDKHPDPHNGRDRTLGTKTSSLFRTRRSCWYKFWCQRRDEEGWGDEMMTTQVLTTLSPPSAGCHN